MRAKVFFLSNLVLILLGSGFIVLRFGDPINPDPYTALILNLYLFYIWPKLGTFVLGTHNLDRLISIPTTDTSILNLFILVFPPRYEYHFKIKLIYRLTKDRDSLSRYSNTKFPHCFYQLSKERKLKLSLRQPAKTYRGFKDLKR